MAAVDYRPRFSAQPKDTYESLVCDLREPFRARLDRFVLKVVNLKMIRAEHFEFSHQYEALAK